MRLDLHGQRFGRLVVLRDAPNRGKRTAWLCRYDCGNESVAMTTNLQRATTQSCGCLQREKAAARGAASRTHGRYVGNDRSPTYSSWRAMIARCVDPATRGYQWYGGRGIRVAVAWSGDRGYLAFLEDMGERPVGTSLDRIDSDGDYTSGNCRWATTKEQAANRRRPRPDSYPRQRMETRHAA